MIQNYLQYLQQEQNLKNICQQSIWCDKNQINLKIRYT
jgi:hypothetical protein